MKHLTSIVCRILFIASFVLAGLTAWEKLANFFGFTLTLFRDYNPWRVLELAVVALLFVIALQLREIKMSSTTKDSG